MKDDEKQEKRRLKEEKLRKVADKAGREREKKKQKHKPKCVMGGTGQPLKISDFIQVRNYKLKFLRILTTFYCSRTKIISHYFWKNV